MTDFHQEFSCERLIGDKIFDSDALLEAIAKRGVDVVIFPKKNRALERTFDRDLYREGHRVEDVFVTIKAFRAIMT
ncbi:MAG: hypothetical protein OXC62_16695 [Aestuariivita sp.]|nr:hypothetical protein [Aestuariivita sp.]